MGLTVRIALARSRPAIAGQSLRDTRQGALAMIYSRGSILLVALALLAGCDTMPVGPTVTALQGADKGLDEFRTDDADCRQHAYAHVREVMSASAYHANGVISTPPSAAICVAAGPATDGRDSPAAAGRRTGSFIDWLYTAQFAGYGLQRHCNFAYVQCMYVKGDKVPLLAQERWPAPRSPWPPDPNAYYPRLAR